MAVTDAQKVVVVDKKKHKLIPGHILPGNGKIIGGKYVSDGDGHPGNMRAVMIDRDAFPDPESKQVLDDYPDILIAEESLIFDYAEFYGGYIAPEKYIDPVYHVNDYIVGIANHWCAARCGNQTTIRLVGGTVRGINIIPQILHTAYNYTIEYSIRADVKYSIEQLRRDGMRNDRFYAINPDHIYTTTVNEKLTIAVDDMVGNPRDIDPLRESEKFTLFYIMASLLIKAQMCRLSSKNIKKISDALLKLSWNVLYSGQSRKGRGKSISLDRYETPLKSILDGIIALIATILDPNINPAIADMYVSREITDLFTSGIIYSEGTATIPWEEILNHVPTEILTDPNICGIHQDDFADMVVDFIRLKTTDPDALKSNGNLATLAKQIYSCISSQIKVGSKVILNPNGVECDEKRSNRAAMRALDGICGNRTILLVLEAGADGYLKLVRKSTVSDLPMCPDEVLYVQSSSCIYYDTDIDEMDKYIFEIVK